MSFHEILNLLLYNRIRLLIFTGFTTIFLFFFLLLVYPITFISTTTLLPPEKDNIGGVESMLMGSGAANLLGVNASGNKSQLYSEILKSRSIAEVVVNNCNLEDYFKVEEFQHAVLILQQNSIINVTKEGIIEISVKLKTPWFSRYSDSVDSVRSKSAEIANMYVEALDEINLEKLNQKAKKTKLFIKSEMNKVAVELKDAEKKLEKFQFEHKAINLPAQLEASIESAADIKSQIINLEIQKKNAELNLSDNSMDLQSFKEKLKILNEKYVELETGQPGVKDYLPGMDKVPELQLKLGELYREVKIKTELYLLLQKQYYSEQIQENKNIPTVEVLDKAIPPVKQASPRLIFHTASGGLTAFLLLSVILIYSEQKKNQSLKKRLE